LVLILPRAPLADADADTVLVLPDAVLDALAEAMLDAAEGLPVTPPLTVEDADGQFISLGTWTPAVVQIWCANVIDVF